MHIQRDVLLSSHTTFKIGGPCRYFVVATSTEDIISAINLAREERIPWMVLGEGSNILVADSGFNGVVICCKLRGVSWNERGEGVVECVMSAGEHWDTVVEQSVERGLSGFENLSAIPGTVGAAPVQNIGAYGREIKDVLAWVDVLDTRTCTERRLSADECQLSYRMSLFKKPEGAQYIVLRVACVLRRDVAPDSSYADVRAWCGVRGIVTPTIADVRRAVVDIRRNKLPDLSVCGTAGSFFKNPVVSFDEYERVRATFPTVVAHDAPEGKKKISAAWLLDVVCGYKGVRVGDAGVHERQSLVLVNYGNATAKDIMSLAHAMQLCVKKNTHIDLVPEVVMIGEHSYPHVRA